MAGQAALHQSSNGFFPREARLAVPGDPVVEGEQFRVAQEHPKRFALILGTSGDHLREQEAGWIDRRGVSADQDDRIGSDGDPSMSAALLDLHRGTEVTFLNAEYGEINPVVAPSRGGLKAENPVLAEPRLQDKCVRAQASIHQVIPDAAIKYVVVSLAPKLVVPGSADHYILAAQSEDIVVSAHPLEGVGTLTSHNPVSDLVPR